ncbi:cytochrome P450 [Bimuria novae-zelandiae CBS 107.79]|uniref:Cytochrome P450 n=1 Tax=Bimuria novae-zelandiae CBS 107.79 TaxID=1447943 RepID=A0A6A5V3S5_9PLEO|nr:cytochrome P450 [Bimuria novae-zelandiae CBS 107.79]
MEFGGPCWLIHGSITSRFAIYSIGLATVAYVPYLTWLIWFHPLSRFPVKALHGKYGDVVRWAPNELSFACADAWKDIYDRRKDGKVLTKDPVWYRKDATMRAEHIVNADDPARHAEIHKMMAYAFSAKALLEQEDLILQYTGQLGEAIKEQSARGPINLDAAIWTLPIVPYFQYWLTPKAVREGGARYAMESKEDILRGERDGPKSDRIDFVSYILKKRQELNITDSQLAAHSNALIVAGSETSATVLSGLFFYLCKHPDVYAKRKKEVRSDFTSADEIMAKGAEGLSYLTACTNETFRIYPPIPIAMPRVTPKGSCTITGCFVPEGTVIGVYVWSVTHNPENFNDPDAFHPERWFEKSDNLDASNPFLMGPRMCMGINMTWIEVRVMAAQIAHMFDFELEDKTFD